MFFGVKILFFFSAGRTTIPNCAQIKEKLLLVIFEVFIEQSVYQELNNVDINTKRILINTYKL